MIRFRSILLVLLGAGLVLSVCPARAQQLLVSGFTSESVVLYDGTTGALVRVFDEVRGPQSMVFGPDGNLYPNLKGWALFLTFFGRIAACPCPQFDLGSLSSSRPDVVPTFLLAPPLSSWITDLREGARVPAALHSSQERKDPHLLATRPLCSDRTTCPPGDGGVSR